MKAQGPVVITGFMGCGKTEVARKLAERLAVTVVDLDDVITQSVGRSPAQLLAEDGEPEFRHIETNTLRSVLENSNFGVIALGGGAWIEAANRTLISEASGLSVWLDTPFAVCWHRIEASGDDRPLGKSQDQAHSLFQRRRPIYQLASIRIDTTGDESVEELASRVKMEVDHARQAAQKEA
jgi:shikimate kinase